MRISDWGSDGCSSDLSDTSLVRSVSQSELMLVTAMTAKPVISRASWSGERAVGLSMLADTGGCRVFYLSKISMLINCIRIAFRSLSVAGRGREDSMARKYPYEPLEIGRAYVWEKSVKNV